MLLRLFKTVPAVNENEGQLITLKNGRLDFDQSPPNKRPKPEPGTKPFRNVWQEMFDASVSERVAKELEKLKDLLTPKTVAQPEPVPILDDHHRPEPPAPKTSHDGWPIWAWVVLVCGPLAFVGLLGTWIGLIRRPARVSSHFLF